MIATTTNNDLKFPAWFVVLTSMVFVSNLVVFGWATLLFPSFAFPDIGHTEAAFPIQFFAIRHIAFSVPLLLALIRKDSSVLEAMYTLFLIMSVMDVGLLIVNDYYIPVLGNPPLLAKSAIGVVLFIVPMSLGLFQSRTYQTR